MGATRNTGYLENLIQYDASDNVAIATSVNPSYKVTLGGSMLGTSALFSLSSGIGMTIRGDWDRSATNNSQLYIQGNTNTNKQLRIGYDTTGNVGYIQALTSGTSVDKLLINPSGGNVGIGTTSPTQGRLVVSGAVTNSIMNVAASINGGNNALNIGDDGTNAAIGVGNSGTDIVFMRRVTGVYSEAMRITSGGNVLLSSDKVLGINTSDGSDNGYLALCGASADGDTRGARIYLSGNERTVDAGNIVIAAGNSTSGTGAPGTIVFRTGADTERMRITSGGNVLIGGTTAASVRLGTFAPNNTSSSYSFVAWNNSGNDIFAVRGDGIIQAVGTYNNTTSAAANVWVDTDGSLRRSTSSLKYKNNIQSYDKGLDIVSKLRPVYYNGINDGKTLFAGLIAEEVHELGLTEFVQYAEDGSPDALAYQNMVALLTKAIQELNQKIEALENK